jgi:hypothetical protein
LDVIPAWPICYQNMLTCNERETRDDPNKNRNSWQDYKCSVCTNWGTDLSNPLLRFKQPQYFPKKYILGGELDQGDLLPYDVLSKVLGSTFRMVSMGKWTTGQGKTYMTSNCINSKYATVAVVRATNVFNLQNAQEDAKDSPWLRRLLLDEENHPEKYKLLDLPAMYTRGVPLHIFVDPLMHLLLLGVCRSVFQRVSSWAARLGPKNAFKIYASSLLEQ